MPSFSESIGFEAASFVVPALRRREIHLSVAIASVASLFLLRSQGPRGLAIFATLRPSLWFFIEIAIHIEPDLNPHSFALVATESTFRQSGVARTQPYA